MDELIEDLKRQSEKAEDQKSLFTSVSDIESEMQRYEKWIKETKVEIQDSNKDKALTLKVKPDEAKEVEGNKEKTDPSQNILKKEDLDSLQKIVNNQSQKLDEE